MTARIRDEKRKLTLADLVRERAEADQRRLMRRMEKERKLRAHFYQDALKIMNAAFGVDAMRRVVELVLLEKGLTK
jgi:hypothetical protein